MSVDVHVELREQSIVIAKLSQLHNHLVASLFSQLLPGWLPHLQTELLTVDADPDWTPLQKQKKKGALSLPAFLRLVGLLLLPLSLSSHLLELLSVFPLDEALLMSHLWEVIWYRERQSGKQREVDQGEQIKRETQRQGCEETRSVSNWARTAIYGSNCTGYSFHGKCHVVTLVK